MSYIPDNLRSIRVRDKISRTAFEIYTAFCDYADSETGFTFVSIERIADECGEIRHNSARSYLKELIAAGWMVDTFGEFSGKQIKGFSLKCEKTAWLSLYERSNKFDKKIVKHIEADKKIVNIDTETPVIDKKIVEVDKKFVNPPHTPHKDISLTNQGLNQEKTEELSEADVLPKSKKISSKPKREISAEEQAFRKALWQTQTEHSPIKAKGKIIDLYKTLAQLFVVSGGNTEFCQAIHLSKKAEKWRTKPVTWNEVLETYEFDVDRLGLETKPEPSPADEAETLRLNAENWEKQRNDNRNFDEKLRNKKHAGTRPAAAVESGSGENDHRGDILRQPADGLSFEKFEGGGFLFVHPSKNLPRNVGNLPNELNH